MGASISDAETARAPAHSGASFDVAAIGASAGGVEALYELLGRLHDDFPATLLVVQHMDPRHKSMLAELLGRRCRVPVKEAVDGEVTVDDLSRAARACTCSFATATSS